MNLSEAFSLDTINTLVIVAGILSFVYGLLVYARNRSSLVSQSFFTFALSVGVWSIAMAIYRSPEVTPLVVWAARLLYVAAALIPATFIIFVRLFEADVNPSWRWYALALVPCSIMVLISFTPHVLIEAVLKQASAEPRIVFDPRWHLLYILYIITYGSAGFWILFRKYKTAQTERRNKLLYIMMGTFIPLSVSVITNLILPFLGDFDFNWVGQISTFAMTSLITYGMFRHNVFDVRVIATELLMFLLWAIAFSRIVLSNTITEALFNAAAFLILLVVGLLLTRSVYNEVISREKIERLAEELEIANKRQETLLHFVTHEIKGFLTKGEGAFAGIVEGDYGEAPPAMRDLASNALLEMRKGVATVGDILNASNLKKGTVSFEKHEFDLIAVIDTVVQALEQHAQEKHLVLEFTRPVTGTFTLTGDEVKIRDHVVRNLVENALNYTQEGSVRVGLSRSHGGVRLVVADTGVGITPEDMNKLFTEGGHGKDSIKVNVNSTGYGLFIAKQVVDAHSGKIWAESDGAGKGSRFIVELPTT